MKNIRMENKGFTLVEVLIVIAISALFSTFAVIYSQAGQNQVALSVEESKVGQLILEARELSVATYSMTSNTCAYGIQFDYANQTYSLFAYNTATPVGASGRPICPSVASTSAAISSTAIQEYAGASWKIHPAQGVTLVNEGSASGTVQDILFYPPDPCALVSLVGETTFEAACGGLSSWPAVSPSIYLQTTDGSAGRTVSIDPAGQVTL